MNHALISERLVQAMARMPSRLQSAGRYVLENPRDVALLSMREQARRAGLQPATMTRLAKRLGLDGYDAVRALHAEAIRSGGLGFAGKATEQVNTQKLKGDRALAADMASSLAGQVAQLAAAGALDAIAAAAAALHRARRIYCLGLRSCHPVAWHLHYILSLFRERTTLLDGVAGVGADPIRHAGPRDLLFAASVRPYTRASVETTRYAAARGVPVVVITDSPASPLAPLASHVLLAMTRSPSFFHSMTPAFALAEILATLAAGQAGDEVPRALRETEEQLGSFGVHWTAKPGRRRPARRPVR